MYEDLRDEEKKHVAKIQTLIENWKGQLEGS
jgi:rubrerythrin